MTHPNLNPEKTMADMLGIAYPVQREDIERLYGHGSLVAAAVWEQVEIGRADSQAATHTTTT